MKRILFLSAFLSLLLVSGCHDIMSVQTGYVSDRDQCRENSENQMNVYTPSESYAISTKEKNTALLTLFCECMRQKEWKVAGCPKPKEKEKDIAKPATPPPANNTTVVVVQAPPPAAAAPEQEQPQQSKPASAPKIKKHPAKKVCPAPQTVCTTTDNAPFDDSDTATLKKILGKEN